MISIIVPVYNTEKYLARCIDSVLAQTYKDFELILIDDGSIDDSGKICDKYKEKDNRIIVRHIENGGVSHARNIGLEIADGEYICFLDSDDYYLPNYCEQLIFAIDDADLIICGAKESDGNIWSPDHDYTYNSLEEFKKDYLFWRTNYLICPPWNKLYKKSLIRANFREDIFHSEDLIFNLEYLKKCNQIKFISRQLIVHDKTNNSSLTRKIDKRLAHNASLVYSAENNICKEIGTNVAQVNYIKGFLYSTQAIICDKNTNTIEKLRHLKIWGKEEYIWHLKIRGEDCSTYTKIKFLILRIFVTTIAIF